MTKPRVARLLRRPFWALLCGLAFLAPLPAYYHFLHIRTDGNTMRAIPERFDLRVLPDGAVPLVVSRSVEPEFAGGDTWESLISQVRLAAEQWSAVPYSALRLRYAGEVTQEPAAGTPYVQVLFEELPPGVIAMAGPVARETLTSDERGAFVPITRSVVILSHRLQERQSYSEAFYMTLVHEMGHALGLQHTFTGSVMSTGVTRATTKAAPLAADDHAGLATLYPDGHFAADTGTIRGRVSADGEPVHFANVTALQPSGVAVSALTLPDGAYEIRGLPPGGYYLYAQPVAASTQEGLGPGQIVLPKDEGGNSIAAGGLFATRFYPEAADWHGAHSLLASPGGVLNEIHLNVPRVGGRAFGDITTYSFPANFAVNPAVVNTGGERPFLVAFGANLVENGQKADGLRVDSTAAGIVDEDVSAYEPAPQFLRINLTFHPFTASLGAKPLLWSRNGETFVQPSAFRVVGQQPPDVREAATEAGENGRELIRLRGAQLAPSFTYTVDGVVAETLPVQEELRSQEVLLRAPYTSDGRPVRVVALGSDGQSSLFLNANPPSVPSRIAGSGGFRLSAVSLPAGAETMLAIESDTGWFAEGELALSFNSPHVVARRVWRESAGRLIANVKAMPGAGAGEVPIWLAKDVASVDSQLRLSVAPPDGASVSVDSLVIDENTGDATIYPGGNALVRISGDGLGDSVRIVLVDRAVDAARVDGSRFRLPIPADLPAGLTTLRAEVPGRTSFPIAVEIAGPPPAILEGESFLRVDAQSGPERFRARLLLRLPGIPSDGRESALLEVRVNGQSIRSFERSVPSEGAELVQVSFDVPASLTAAAGEGGAPGSVTVTARWSERHSAPFALPLAGR